MRLPTYPPAVAEWLLLHPLRRTIQYEWFFFLLFFNLLKVLSNNRTRPDNRLRFCVREEVAINNLLILITRTF